MSKLTDIFSKNSKPKSKIADQNQKSIEYAQAPSKYFYQAKCKKIVGRA